MRLEDVLVEVAPPGSVRPDRLVGQRLGEVPLETLIAAVQGGFSFPATFHPEEVEHGIEQDYL
jgi:hypothetical protein